MKIERLNQYIIFLVFILVFFYIKTKSYYFLAGYFAIGYFLLVLTLTLKKISLNNLVVIFGFFSLFVLVSIFSQGVNPYFGLYNLQYGVISFVLAYLLVFKSEDTRILAKFLYYLYLFYLISIFINLGFEDDEAYNNVFDGSSRNFLSGILIMLAINVGISHEKVKQSQPLLIYAITFVCCYLLYGRSGILLSFVLLLFAIYQKSAKTFLLVIFVSIVYILSTDFLFEVFQKIQESSNFSRGFRSDRLLFSLEYFEAIKSNTFAFLLGANFDECCQLIVQFDKNPHNSFIAGHSRYGFLHTILSLLLLILVIYSRRLTLIFLALIIYARYALDQMGLFTYFDVFLFQIVMLSLYPKENILASDYK